MQRLLLLSRMFIQLCGSRLSDMLAIKMFIIILWGQCAL